MKICVPTGTIKPMKRRILPLLFLVPAVVFLGGASLPLQSVMLNFEPLPENLLPLADKGVSGELTDSPQELLKGEPSYGLVPFYGAILLGEGSGSRFIFSLDGNILYFDSDHDGDLSNNQPLASQPVAKGLFRKTLLSFPPVSIQLNYSDDILQEYRLAVTCDLEKKTFSFVNVGYRLGMIVFLPPAKNLSAAIYDANPPNGIFNDFGKDILLLDFNRDREFDISPGSPEKIQLAKTLNFAGDVYGVEVMASGEYMDIRQPPVDKQPSGVVALTYVTEVDNKNKIQSGEVEVLFRDGGFQVVCDRGPAAFRRGRSSKVFIRNGELTLYDFYNRPWKAEFIGDSLTPAAVLTFFPSQFNIGFPLKMDLTTDKKEYYPAENVVISASLIGQAREKYTYFALGDVSPRSRKPNEIVFEESKPHMVIKDPAGNVVAQGDAASEQSGLYQATWRIPAETVSPDAGALYSVIVSWDTGSFQGVVTAEAQLSILKLLPKGKK